MADVRIPSFGIKTVGGITTTGNVFFVDSGNSHAADGNDGRSTEKPMATIDAAIGRCTASNGDVIFVLPGHTESLTSSIALDVAGVSVIGLGQGHTRPQLVYDGTGGIVTITASNCRWSNIVHVCSVAAVVSAISVSGPGTGTATQHTEIDHCRFTFDATGVEFTVMIALGDGGTDSADYVHLHDNWFEAENIDGCASALLIDDCQFIHIDNNIFTGDYSSVCIDGAAGSSACLDYVIANNIIENRDNSGCIDLDDSATGMVVKNAFCGVTASTIRDQADIGACLAVENYVCDAADTYGIIVPKTASA